MEVQDLLPSIGWNIAGNVFIPASPAQYFPIQDFELSRSSKKLVKYFDEGIYLHQREVIRYSKETACH